MILDAIHFILAGLFVGFCVGITGVGGGSLMTPILILLFKVDPHIAIGTDLIYASISKFCGSLVHSKKMNVVWGIVLWLAIGSIPTSLFTTWVLEHYLSHSGSFKSILTIVLGAMLTLTGFSIVFRTQVEAFFAKYRKNNPDQSLEDIDTNVLVKQKRGLIVLMGVILGVFVTLSSVGAGAFGVMALLVMFPNLPMIRIIGSDVVHAVALTLVAGLGHMTAGNVDYVMLGWLLVGSIPAIVIGTLISSKMPEKMIRRILGIVLILLGVNFILHPTKAKPAPQKPQTVQVINTQSASIKV